MRALVGLCGRRIMAITLASQAKDVGSIPIARSIAPVLGNSTIVGHSLEAGYL